MMLFNRLNKPPKMQVRKYKINLVMGNQIKVKY